MLKRAIIGIGAIALLILALACTAEKTPTPKSAAAATSAPATAKPEKGGVLRVATTAAMQCWDVHTVCTSGGTRYFQRDVHETLVDFDKEGKKIIPDLAESWTIAPDGLSITFKLNPKAKFQDGSSVKANDVKFTLERLAALKQRWSPNYRSVKEFVVKDDQTIVFDLSVKDSSVLPMLANQGGFIYSEAYVKKVGDKEYGLKPLGTGPFEVVSWSPEKITLKKASAPYWKNPDLPHLDGIEVLQVSDDTVRLVNLRTGISDLIEWLPPKDVAAVKKDTNFKYFETPGTGSQWEIYFNHKQPPFDNVHLRQAVNYAIDYNAIREKVDYGLGTVSANQITPASWAFDPNVKEAFNEFNIEKAKEHLRLGGKPDGFETRLAIPTITQFVSRAEAMQAMLAKVGIQAKIDAKEMVEAINLIGRPEHQLMLLWVGSYEDPDYYFARFYSKSPWNLEGYKNDEFDKLYEQQKEVYDFEKRKPILMQMARNMQQNAAKAYPFGIVNIAAANLKVQNFFLPFRDQWYFQEVWLKK